MGAELKEIQHSMKAVVRLTGLSQHVIRIWELRYAAVSPARTDGNRRLYSVADVERLKLLAEATRNGHTISLVAKLTAGQLRQLVPATSHHPAPGFPAATGKVSADKIIEECFAAMQALDESGLHDALKRGLQHMGYLELLHKVIGPLAQKMGEFWINGHITVGQEHFATEALRNFLSESPLPYGGNQKSPLLLVATPAGQLHEIGAYLVRSAAAQAGWRVVYLGASVPAADLAHTARQGGARAVALSIVHPEDDEDLPRELAALRKLLPPEVAIIAGGRALPAYAPVLAKIQAVTPRDLPDFLLALNELRRRGPGSVVGNRSSGL